MNIKYIPKKNSLRINYSYLLLFVVTYRIILLPWVPIGNIMLAHVGQSDVNGKGGRMFNHIFRPLNTIGIYMISGVAAWVMAYWLITLG